jgi:hypothetical protein
MSLEIVSKWQLYLAKEHIGKAYALYCIGKAYTLYIDTYDMMWYPLNLGILSRCCGMSSFYLKVTTTAVW